ncbi:MAG: hypothetical protein M1831_001788 [Alyxoria varia]|nr:MAG: hypothetical protein M1831_001788 [Alyxoria varia]
MSLSFSYGHICNVTRVREYFNWTEGLGPGNQWQMNPYTNITQCTYPLKGLWTLPDFSKRKHPCPGETLSYRMDTGGLQAFNRIELTGGFEFERHRLIMKKYMPEDHWALERYRSDQPHHKLSWNTVSDDNAVAWIDWAATQMSTEYDVLYFDLHGSDPPYIKIDMLDFSEKTCLAFQHYRHVYACLVFGDATRGKQDVGHPWSQRALNSGFTRDDELTDKVFHRISSCLVA